MAANHVTNILFDADRLRKAVLEWKEVTYVAVMNSKYILIELRNQSPFELRVITLFEVVH